MLSTRAIALALGLAASSLLAAACSRLPVIGNTNQSSPKGPSPEADPKAPGMIPQDCEKLLNLAHEWGADAASEAWKPASVEQALAAAQFFATFSLVPETTSQFNSAWLEESTPKSEEAAKASLDRRARAQPCDLLLAHKLLLGLVKYRWSKADRAKAGGYLHSFLVNQQARISPALARAVQIDVGLKATRNGLVRLPAKTLEQQQRWLGGEIAKVEKKSDEATTATAQWELGREELRLSEDARVRLGKILPLP